jgi:hypothetical protein
MICNALFEFLINNYKTHEKWGHNRASKQITTKWYLKVTRHIYLQYMYKISISNPSHSDLNLGNTNLKLSVGACKNIK